MPSSRKKVKSRFFGFNRWDHKLRIAVAFPILFVLGYAIGSFTVAPFVPLPPSVVGAISGALGILLGSAPLALVD